MASEQTRNELEMFLAEARKNLSISRPTCVVMGNEAADLDSMASAVVYAWYKAKTAATSKNGFVPLLPIARKDFKLRTEATYLFLEAGISEKSLLFLEDIDLAALHAKGLLSLILVDHNKLGKAFAEYSDVVEGVLDHHQDEGLYPHAKERVIEPVGSTTTLVAERVLKDLHKTIDKHCALLLVGTILLDTVNLDPGAGRVTPKDSEMAAALLPIAGRAQNELFEKLQYEKFNVASLSTFDLLRKDYKEYAVGSVRYGMSSVLLSLDMWKKKDTSLAAELERYAKAMKLSLLVVMNAYTEPKFTRELVIYSPYKDLYNKVVKHLSSLDLGLSSLDPPKGSDPSKYGWFAQANESYSRKKLQPLLHQCL